MIFGHQINHGRELRGIPADCGTRLFFRCKHRGIYQEWRLCQNECFY